ncbi:hypothetical protein RR48_06986 [Papilio machaon]|uniref:Uncharacterized protein n=1 Tax=Papilio machaon TaxID=76193 RepID=A0A194RE82_PAPMA|nr:hypothetical protein RR48_06986 [Papilio machaon]
MFVCISDYPVIIHAGPSNCVLGARSAGTKAGPVPSFACLSSLCLACPDPALAYVCLTHTSRASRQLPSSAHFGLARTTSTCPTAFPLVLVLAIVFSVHAAPAPKPGLFHPLPVYHHSVLHAPILHSHTSVVHTPVVHHVIVCLALPLPQTSSKPITIYTSEPIKLEQVIKKEPEPKTTESPMHAFIHALMTAKPEEKKKPEAPAPTVLPYYMTILLAIIAYTQAGIIAPVVHPVVAHPVVHSVHSVHPVVHPVVHHAAPIVHAPVVHAAPIVPIVKHTPVIAVHH